MWPSEDAPTELQWLTDDGATGSLPSASRRLWAASHAALGADQVEGELFGGFQFFDRREREPDEELLGTLAAITAQIGNYVRRRRAEAAAEQSKDEFFGLVSHDLMHPVDLDHRVRGAARRERGGSPHRPGPAVNLSM